MSVFSHSRITSFENCPLQFRYRYIDRIKRDIQGVEALVGKAVHEVLENLYTDLPRARESSAADYTAVFNRIWERDFTPKVRIVRENMTPEDYREIGVRCVEKFFNRQYPFREGKVMGCEMKVEFALDEEGQHRMLGYIDRVDRLDSGVIEIHDYKTGRLPRGGSLRSDRQLTLYEIALRARWPWVSEVRHVWHYLAHDRKFTETRTPDDLRRARVMTIRKIKGIEATTHFPARRSPLCSWCDYKDICPAWEEERALTAACSEPTPVSDPLPVSVPDVEPRTGQYRLF